MRVRKASTALAACDGKARPFTRLAALREVLLEVSDHLIDGVACLPSRRGAVMREAISMQSEGRLGSRACRVAEVP